MTTLHQTQGKAEKPQLERSDVNRFIQILISVVLMGLLLFLSAGRVDWLAAWIFLGTYVLTVLTVGVWVARKNPSVVNERGKVAKNTKSWDKVLMTLYTVMMLVLMIVAGLDAGRYGWSTMPIVIQIAGWVGLMFAMIITYWAMATNTFLATVVRIQDDRGHHVSTAGPYRYVRHPMYAAILIVWPSVALLLGSWWALIPAAVIDIIFVIRTRLEDRTLQAELPGYVDYTQHTRYRLIPGVW
jgi:protein-S-isoprenylcysteine O-methyltransferase Ste14